MNQQAFNFSLTATLSQVEKDNTYAGIQYTPLDMAEYVFWTGDERGVSLAVEDFLRERLVSTHYYSLCTAELDQLHL